MPTYEYLCRGCGERLEVVQSFADAALTTCPSCQGELRKVFSAAGLIFKGSGWHVKDYAASGSGGTGTGTSTGGASGSSTGAPDGAATKSEHGAKQADGGAPRSEPKPAATPAPASSTGD